MKKKLVLLAAGLGLVVSMNAQTATKLDVLDTRAINSGPNNYANEVKFEFKQLDILGLPSNGFYSGMLTLAPWGDNSGNQNHQLNFNDGGIYYRKGWPSNTTWEPWVQLWHSGNLNRSDVDFAAQNIFANGNIRTITQEFSNGGQDGGKIEAFRAPEQNNLFGLNFYTSVGYSTTGAGYQLAMSLRRVWGSGDYISKLDLNGILQSTTNSGSNIYLSKTTGSSIAFNNGAGTDHALIEANSTVNGLEFWTNPGSGISEAMRIIGNGNVLIGKTTQNDGVYYKLDVAGSIRANEIKVNMDGADFVFEPYYKLRSLAEVETFIIQHKHLPDVAPAAEMQSNGVSMGEMQAKLLQKVEELTLYSIEQDKKNAALEQKLAEQDAKYQQLLKAIEELKKK